MNMKDKAKYIINLIILSVMIAVMVAGHATVREEQRFHFDNIDCGMNLLAQVVDDMYCQLDSIKQSQSNNNNNKNNIIMRDSNYFVVIKNGNAFVTRPDGYIRYTITKPGAIGAGMSPNGEHFVIGYKNRVDIYKTDNGCLNISIPFSECNVMGVNFASNDSIAISCTNGQSGLYGINGAKIRCL